MTLLIASFLGTVFRHALLGALLGWLLRKAMSLTLLQSYAVGITAAAAIGFGVETIQELKTPTESAVFAVLAWPVALALLWLTAKRRPRSQA